MKKECAHSENSSKSQATTCKWLFNSQGGGGGGGGEGMGIGKPFIMKEVWYKENNLLKVT